MSTFSIVELPQEIICHIDTFFDVPSRYLFGQTCQWIRECIRAAMKYRKESIYWQNDKHYIHICNGKKEVTVYENDFFNDLITTEHNKLLCVMYTNSSKKRLLALGDTFLYPFDEPFFVTDLVSTNYYMETHIIEVNNLSDNMDDYKQICHARRHGMIAVVCMNDDVHYITGIEEITFTRDSIRYVHKDKTYTFETQKNMSEITLNTVCNFDTFKYDLSNGNCAGVKSRNLVSLYIADSFAVYEN